MENEYGAFGYGDFPRDLKYLEHVRQQLELNGVTELLFTSDSPAQTADMGALPGGERQINSYFPFQTQLGSS